MKNKSFTITGEYIELIKLLKAAHICNSGGEAKQLVEEGLVFYNGVQEFRKRAKIRKGDIVKIKTLDIEILIDSE